MAISRPEDGAGVALGVDEGLVDGEDDAIGVALPPDLGKRGTDLLASDRRPRRKCFRFGEIGPGHISSSRR